MSTSWIFRRLQPGDKDRQPTQGEFFATDAIDSFAEALVRESIQNSLDAKIEDYEQPVFIRFHLGVIQEKTARHYFQNGWDHFSAKDNGLDDVPAWDQPCNFLAIEDFGTTGLIGDIKQCHPIDKQKNPFYYFFRTEGRSGKSEGDRGRWGIGKYVFPRSSRIKALLALTVRHDDHQRLLMGQAILNSHNINNQYFKPDGDYGISSENGLVLPETDPGFLDDFANNFSLKRENTPGLSVVVPWVCQDEFTIETLQYAVIEDYFFSILYNNLTVSISNDTNVINITSQTLMDVCKKLGEKFEAKMLPLIHLSNWAITQNDQITFILNPANSDRPKWEPKQIPEEILENIQEEFRLGKMLSVKVPLTVREKNKPNKESWFKIFLVKDDKHEGSSVFIREGIIISDARGRKTPGVRSIVVVDHAPLASLLGDSENPAHTQWQKDREHFKNKYIYGKSYIDFVTQSVSTLVKYINESDEKPDKELLKGIFSVPREKEEEQEKILPRKRNRGEYLPPDLKVEPRKRRFSLSKIPGGFTIIRGDGNADFPILLEIKVAYDRRRGSPLKKYDEADFKLNASPITVVTTGASIEESRLNRMLIRTTEPDFKIMVHGFDENRDLFVGVSVKAGDNNND